MSRWPKGCLLVPAPLAFWLVSVSDHFCSLIALLLFPLPEELVPSTVSCRVTLRHHFPNDGLISILIPISFGTLTQGHTHPMVLKSSSGGT